MKKLLLVVLWFQAATITFFLTTFALYLSDQSRAEAFFAPKEAKRQHEFYAALPQIQGSFTTSVQAADARPEIIRRYLKRFQSPLLPFSDLIVELSDKNKLDFRLIVSIAQCESNLCKRIPDGSYNCWGFQNGETRFLSWEQALNQVARTLKVGYIDKGLITPEQIMPKYAPPALEKDGSWAKCVNYFFDELK